MQDNTEPGTTTANEVEEARDKAEAKWRDADSAIDEADKRGEENQSQAPVTDGEKKQAE